MRGLQGFYILQTGKFLFVRKDGALRALNARFCTECLNTQGKGGMQNVEKQNYSETPCVLIPLIIVMIFRASDRN